MVDQLTRETRARADRDFAVKDFILQRWTLLVLERIRSKKWWKVVETILKIRVQR